MALSIAQIFIKIFGAIPGPIIFGVIFDANCLFWLKTECEDKGACYFYDMEQLSMYLLVLCVALKLVSITFFSLSLFAYKTPNDNSLTIS